MIGEGPAARSIKLDLPPFTLVGATTRAGLLTSPLRDRFGIVQRLDFYAERRARGRSCRFRGDPRRAPPTGRRHEDCRAVAGHTAHRQSPAAPRSRLRRGARGRPTSMPASRERTGPARSGRRGLRRARSTLLTRSSSSSTGGPVGIDSLAASLGEERDTLEDVVEPFLIQQGFLVRTARGRMATRRHGCISGCEPPAERRRASLPLFRGWRQWNLHWPVRVYYEDTDAGGCVYYADIPPLPGAGAHASGCARSVSTRPGSSGRRRAVRRGEANIHYHDRRASTTCSWCGSARPPEARR